MDSMTTAILLLIVVLVLHLAEEVRTGFREQFIIGEMPLSVFIGINVVLYTFCFAALFLKLGFTAFGGPAAHIVMMHSEVVRRRKWLDEQRFLDLLGATQLIPGPNSTEMAIHIGFVRAGWVGSATNN